MIKPTFAFFDESGNLSPNNPDRYFAVGTIIDSFPDGLVQELHLSLQHLEGRLQRTNDPKLEFKFGAITKTSFPVYQEILEKLHKHPSWRFCCLIVDTDDDKFSQPNTAQEIWEAYLRFTKLLLQNNLKNDERTVLIADYYRQPAGEVHELATLPQVVPNLVDTLQVESQGVLPVQLADILLGACLYEGKDQVRLKLQEQVRELEEAVGKERFDRWRIKWNYKY